MSYYEDNDADELAQQLADAERRERELQAEVERLRPLAARAPKPKEPDPYVEAIANAQNEAEVLALVKAHGGLLASEIE